MFINCADVCNNLLALELVHLKYSEHGFQAL